MSQRMTVTTMAVNRVKRVFNGTGRRNGTRMKEAE